MQNTYIKMWFIWNPIFVLCTYRETGIGEGVRWLPPLRINKVKVKVKVHVFSLEGKVC